MYERVASAREKKGSARGEMGVAQDTARLDRHQCSRPCGTRMGTVGVQPANPNRWMGLLSGEGGSRGARGRGGQQERVGEGRLRQQGSERGGRGRSS